MKSRILKTSTGGIIFLILVISAIAVINPVYERINSFLQVQENKILKTFTEKTDLEIKWESLSPSILSGINIKNIRIQEKKSKNVLFEVKKASISYKISDFFGENPLNGIKLLLLDGVVVEFDAVNNSEMLLNLQNLLSEQKQDSKNSKDDKKNKQKISFNGKQFLIPFNIQLKNLSFHYSDKNNNLLVSLKNIFVKTYNHKENGIEISSSGRIDYKNSALKYKNRLCTIASAFSISGTLFDDLEGSSFMIKLSEVPKSDFTLSRADILFNYQNSKLTLRNMKNPLPYSFIAEGDFKNSECSFFAQAKDFEFLKLVNIKIPFEITKKISGSKLSGTVDGNFSFKEKNKIFDSLKLFVDGDLFLSKKLVGSSLNASYKVNLENKIVNVEKFNVEGDILSADIEGSYDLQKNEPYGNVNLNYFVLKNGGYLQTEFYIEPYKNGFLVFAPQLFLGDKSLTALSFLALPSQNSWDFSFECSDYSHEEYEKSGHILIDGSLLLGKEKILQASATFSDLFLDSVAEKVAFFLPEKNREKLNGIAKNLSPYIFSDELYFSTDFKSITFNSPFFILANSQKERQLLTFSVDGSNETISLSNLDLQYENYNANATAGFDFNGNFNDFNFYSNLVVNGLPYSFSGSFSEGFLNVSGEYDFSLATYFDENVNGSIHFASLPIPFAKNIFLVSLNSSFSLNENLGPKIEIENFDLSEGSSNIKFKPHFAFVGTANKYGLAIEKLTFSDTTSALQGNANLSWSINDSIVDSATLALDVQSIIGGEKINLNAEIKNPELKPFTFENIKKDFFIFAQGNLRNFYVSHFFDEQTANNVLNCDFSASGTIENPFVSLNVLKSSVNFGGFPAFFTAEALYDEEGVSVTNLNANWGKFTANDFVLNFNPKNFDGKMTGGIHGEFLELDFDIPLEINVKSLTPERSLSENLILTLESEKMTGSFFPSGEKLNIIATKTGKIIEVVSDNGNGFTARLNGNGTFNAKSGISSPIFFDLDGSVIHNVLDISITNLQADLKKVSEFISIPYVNFTKGSLSGAVKISGVTTDPEFTGAVSVLKPEFTVPFVSKGTFRTEKLFATAGQNSFIVKPTLFTLDKNPVTVGLDIEFDRWGIDFLDCSIETEKDDFIPVDMQFPFLHFKGFAGFQDFLIHVVKNMCTFTGKITGQKADLIVSMNDSSEMQAANSSQNKKSSMEFVVDLDLNVLNRVQILYNPFLRGVINPGSSVGLFIDTSTMDFAVKGDVALRGGEIVWLNRSFYMKEGKITLNESNLNFDPKITVRAETRERDQNNNPVTIILSAQNASLSQFYPRISSIPAKSESEIMELLGNVISADSENVASLAMAGGDYLMQATVMRKVENTLRELCNFDIFSIRTNILQNAVKYGIENKSNSNGITFSNFFDNSAVYVGKYFGNAIYVDALMHFNYDETKIANETSVHGLVFQPEFGLEMESPFVNIRLGLSPDIDAIRNNVWLPSTSITLSKKISF